MDRETTVEMTKTRKTHRKPWHLHGREGEIADYRAKGLSWNEIAEVVKCSGEGARQAYRRYLQSKQAA
jgi:DNA-binding CsgD family transcriptional regulator